MFFLEKYNNYPRISRFSLDLGQAERWTHHTTPYSSIKRSRLDLDIGGLQGITLLILAVHTKSANYVNTLSEDEEMLHAKDKRGYTALAHAVALKDVECATTLIKAGADIKDAVKPTNSESIVRSLYALAFMHDAMDVLKELTTDLAQCFRGCDASILQDAYYVALCAGHPSECCRLETECGFIMPSYDDLWVKEEFDMAFLCGVLKVLASKHPPEKIKRSRDNMKTFYTRLIEDAGRCGKDDACVRRIEHLALIHAAYAKQDVETLDYLLKHAKNVNYVGAMGRTALYWAVRWAKHRYVERLLAAGADPLCRANNGDTPLTCAVRNHQGVEALELVQMMLAALSQKYACDQNELVALCCSETFLVAIKQGHEMIADALLVYVNAHGAHLTIGRNVDSVGLMRVAARIGDVSLFENYFEAYSPEALMRNRNQADLRRVFHEAVCARDPVVLSFMIRWYRERLQDDLISDHQQSVVQSLLQSSDACGNTWLHHAASSGSVGAMQALLKLRFDDQSVFPSLNDQNHAGLTPIMLASWRGHLVVVRYLLGLQSRRGVNLLNAQVDLAIKTAKGNTALHLAIGSAAEVVHGVALPSLEPSDAMLAHASAQSPEIATHNYLKIISQLCDHAHKADCASLSMPDAVGRTPFLMLVCGGFLKRVKWFVKNPQKVDSKILRAPDMQGLDALALAETHGHHDLVDYLKCQPFWSDDVSLNPVKDTPAVVLDALESSQEVESSSVPTPAPENAVLPESRPSAWRRAWNYIERWFSSSRREDQHKPVSDNEYGSIGFGVCVGPPSVVPVLRSPPLLMTVDTHESASGGSQACLPQPSSLKRSASDLKRSASESSLVSMESLSRKEMLDRSLGSYASEGPHPKKQLMRSVSEPRVPPMKPAQDLSLLSGKSPVTFNQ